MSACSASGEPTAHVDTFVRDNLPPVSEWPTFVLSTAVRPCPPRVNCASVLLDDAVRDGHGDRVAIYSDSGNWTYLELLAKANQLANFLAAEHDLVPGNRVLLRGTNSAMLMCAWLAVVKAGAVAVTTMPQLRAKELERIATKARITHALCDASLVAEVETVGNNSHWLGHTITLGDGVLEAGIERQPTSYVTVDTAADDPCVIAFTSGTTGDPKATVHFHRDVLASADVVGGALLETTPEDIFVGSPPLGFTFGLGALLVFPLRFRAATVALERPTPDALLTAIEKFQATCLFTAPTMYRTLAGVAKREALRSLTRSVSAGEPLPKATSNAWYAASGIRLIDGIGATELFHIFISAKGNAIRLGATGKVLPGYEAEILDSNGNPVPTGQVGRLAVRGPTGCRYLSDNRQVRYVSGGWNITGDRYLRDDDGYFWFQARDDDMIISSGYNIAAPEVESALLAHEAVGEVAVVGAPDDERGQIVKAFVVLTPRFVASPELVGQLQAFVKATVAPYKYPRSIEFVLSLPKTVTGKIQRAVLRALVNGK